MSSTPRSARRVATTPSNAEPHDDTLGALSHATPALSLSGVPGPSGPHLRPLSQVFRALPGHTYALSLRCGGQRPRRLRRAGSHLNWTSKVSQLELS